MARAKVAASANTTSASAGARPSSAAGAAAGPAAAGLALGVRPQLTPGVSPFGRTPFIVWPGGAPSSFAADLSAAPLRPAMSHEHLEFVLETTGLHRAVHAALLGAVLLPPPAPGARVRAGFHRSGARRAADALIPLVVQRVRRHIVVADVVPHFLVGPVGERIDFDQAAMIVVQLDLADVRARRPLVAPQTGDPRVES